MSSDAVSYRQSLRAPRFARVVSGAKQRVRARPELLGLVAMAGVLNLWGLSLNGWANTYYSAAVRSMSTSWHNFLFASLDPSGLMTVDKPPLSLWVQALSVRIFGLDSLSILIPQALMGIGAVVLIYDLTRRRFGRAGGFAAGLALATTPVAVAVSRHNNPDELLVLCCVAALWFLVRALEDGRTRWLVLSGIMVGLGFETKMGVALMVVPGIAAAYLWVAPSRRPPARHPASPDLAARESSGGRPDLAARESSGGRPPARHPASPDLAARESSGARLVAIRQLFAGGAALAVTGLAWPILVTLTPAADRPWISGTSDNSIWSLMFSYNGLGRIAGQTGGPGGAGGPGGGQNALFGGNTGIFRLLQAGLGDQAGWLLGFAVVAGVAVLVSTRLRRTDPRTGWLIAVGGAFLTSAIVFSFASGIFHPYYLSFLAPFTAALIGAGVGQSLAGGRSARIVAPLAIGAGAVTELIVLGTIGGQLSWAKPVVIALAGACAVALAFALAPRLRWIVLTVSLAALFAAPATWAAETIGHATSSTFPTGGPASAESGGFGGAPGAGGSGLGARAGGGAALRAGGGVASLFGSGTGNSSTGAIPGPPPGGFGGAPGAGGFASPPSAGSIGGPPGAGGLGGGAGRAGGFGGNSATLNAGIKYAQAHGGGTVGVESQSAAASAIVSSNANVAGLGGFSGRESSVTASWLAMEVKAGHLRWVIADTTGLRAPGDTRQGSQSALAVIAKTCKTVKVKTPAGTITMYDCQGRAAAIRAAAGGT